LDLDAQVRRLMEDENKKARKAERSKFIETVRELAVFIQKRDKRVAAHKVSTA
jgi:DnaJ family protein A protein 5